MFIFMGREKFEMVVNEVENLNSIRGYTRAIVYGTIGYGKPYILAALACFLFRKKKYVVYLPDCCEMAKNHINIKYIKCALCLTLANMEGYYELILKCEDIEDLKHLCDILLVQDIHLY